MSAWVLVPSGKQKNTGRVSRVSNYLSPQGLVCFCSCCVEHKCHRYSLDLSFTCVKPDYHREDDRLGISHCVTHYCSVETAHVHTVRRARKGERSGARWGRRSRRVVREQGERSRRTERRQTDHSKVENVSSRNKETKGELSWSRRESRQTLEGRQRAWLCCYSLGATWCLLSSRKSKAVTKSVLLLPVFGCYNGCFISHLLCP